MNKKIIITILGTLLIGFILGFFLAGRLAQKRMRHHRAMMNKPDAEKQFLFKRLELNAEQIEQISPILDSMIPAQMKIRHEHIKEMDSSRNAMFNQIKPMLKANQLEHLDRITRRIRKKPH